MMKRLLVVVMVVMVVATIPANAYTLSPDEYTEGWENYADEADMDENYDVITTDSTTSRSLGTGGKYNNYLLLQQDGETNLNSHTIGYGLEGNVSAARSSDVTANLSVWGDSTQSGTTVRVITVTISDRESSKELRLAYRPFDDDGTLTITTNGFQSDASDTVTTDSRFVERQWHDLSLQFRNNESLILYNQSGHELLNDSMTGDWGTGGTNLTVNYLARAVSGSSGFLDARFDEIEVNTDPIGKTHLRLDVDPYMEHGERQTYTVTWVNATVTDVTDLATVTSSDATLVAVQPSSDELVSTSDTSLNGEVTITASYNGETVSQNVTVANKSINNIGILPPPTWPSALLGGGGDTSPLGDTTGGNDIWPGAVQLQLIFLAISIGAVVGWVTDGNQWGALGAAQIILIGGWTMEYAADGFIIASLFACAFLALTASDVTVSGR